MLTDIIDCNQNLFKLPLFYLINTYCQKPQTNKISYHELTNFVYLYYVNVYYSLKWEEQIPFSSMTIKNVNKYEFSKQDFSNYPAWVEPNNNWANFIWIRYTPAVMSSFLIFIGFNPSSSPMACKDISKS